MGEGYQRLHIESEEPHSPKHFTNRKYYVGGVIAFSALLVLVATLSVALTSHSALPSASHTHTLEVQSDNTPASKRGAGLLLTSGNEVLLLLRNSKHNNNTWGLPGGNVEDEDTNLLVTAKREAQEEMGSVPEAAFLNQILTKRGKHGKKHYTVFVGTMTAAARQQYKPQLNHEHSQWRWFQLEDAVQQPNLHPVVELMFSSAHKQQVLDAMLGP
ncbi:hypothetical protein ABBQ38_009034 [Trebouxia sp. C0009 RCD-2024]